MMQRLQDSAARHIWALAAAAPAGWQRRRNANRTAGASLHAPRPRRRRRHRDRRLPRSGRRSTAALAPAQSRTAPCVMIQPPSVPGENTCRRATLAPTAAVPLHQARRTSLDRRPPAAAIHRRPSWPADGAGGRPKALLLLDVQTARYRRRLRPDEAVLVAQRIAQGGTEISMITPANHPEHALLLLGRGAMEDRPKSRHIRRWIGRQAAAAQLFIEAGESARAQRCRRCIHTNTAIVPALDVGGAT